MTKKTFNPDVDAPVYKGKYGPYDIIKEGTIAVVVVALLTVALAVLFGSPDEKAVTIKTWSNATPLDFVATAMTELDRTSGTATYGPPYNNAATGQQIGPLTLAKWMGINVNVNTATDFVVAPLSTLADQPALKSALTTFTGASSAQRASWEANYTKALGTGTFSGGSLHVSATSAGPVPVMMSSLTAMARSGALDQALVTAKGFYTTDYTKPLLFMADGSFLANKAQAQHLSGDQWGMMNETGSYPGQAWLWLYTMWYQVPPFSTSWSANADALVWAFMMILTLLLALTPWIPGLRSIPRKVKVYRLIWREHYKNA
jgi:hypothetical protein